MPKLTNIQMHIVVFFAMVIALGSLLYMDVDLYKTVLMGAGGWYVGTTLRGWCHSKWPLEAKNE